MEGVHFVAGPWFMVRDLREGGDDWHAVDAIWVSDGQTTERARVEMRVELEEASDAI